MRSRSPHIWVDLAILLLTILLTATLGLATTAPGGPGGTPPPTGTTIPRGDTR